MERVGASAQSDSVKVSSSQSTVKTQMRRISKFVKVFARYCLLITVLLITGSTQAQPKKVPRIGYLGGTSLSSLESRINAFRQGLRDLGYVEGKDILIEYRYAGGKADRQPALAAELAHLKVDMIVTVGAGATRAVKEATATIPIVMAQDSDPSQTDLSTALRGLVVTLRDCRPFRRK